MSTPGPTPSMFQRWGRGGTGVVLALGAVVMLLIGGTIGLTLGNSGDSSSAASLVVPAADSVDVGFLRDMSVHHEQGVLISHIVQGLGGSAAVATIAYDIEYQQTSQIGQMGGFLQLWGYSLNNFNAPMSWMTSAGGHDMAGMAAAMAVDPAAAADGAVMPGMATKTEVAQLQKLTGADADAYFLQLMIRHHEGGLPMMQYATKYATNPVVQNMADKMSIAQVAEVASMTQLLATYGKVPLPAPGAANAGSGTTVTVPNSAAGSMPAMTGMNMAPPTS